MSDVVLRVEDLWKQYRLGLVGSKTLQADMQRWWASIRGKEDPLLKIGAENTLNQTGDDYVWALQNIDFEVKQGEVLGIIGKNGAGKSTLLKILSKVTAPTKGKIYVKGRIASLLEVGTGFHPELTGRENIFLNGAILGMKKAEIKSKLDEIVEFSGVSKYLDTPVKRYSSGMYVRLAFAVAAHLEPDILIVDEVLAVGDVEFQKKAIGKMQDVSNNGGRTVLFVSHNMRAISKLCTNSVLLEHGSVRLLSKSEEVIERYLSQKGARFNTLDNSKHQTAFVESLILLDSSGRESSNFHFDEEWRIHVTIRVMEDLNHFILGIGLAKDEIAINTTWSKPTHLTIGLHSIEFNIKGIQFSPGKYFLTVGMSNQGRTIYYEEDLVSIEMNDFSPTMDDKMLNTSSGLILNQFESKFL